MTGDDMELSPIMMKLAKAISVLKQLVTRGFTGDVYLSFENGKVTFVNVSESIKVE